MNLYWPTSVLVHVDIRFLFVCSLLVAKCNVHHTEIARNLLYSLSLHWHWSAFAIFFSFCEIDLKSHNSKSVSHLSSLKRT